MPPKAVFIDMLGFNAGREAVVAARRRGFTEEPVGKGCCPGGYSR
jgi:hypothetical protein